MLMHKGIGLDRFNALSRRRAVHALYECCCNVTWAEKIADQRPYPDRAALFATAEAELLALSRGDLDRICDSGTHQQIPDRSAQELARITRERIDRMLGPDGGYSTF
ncbi:2-oxo-4-hydroxy-4-carboxy-5-ureidoimidazoline decarboxylase [Nocardia mexicana]|uniref:2-oxo-4-hydroxy-4-carboxy-5-ureidoimidazoline decarboxylase n=1 Tax=Nocardia mexicana TaxID=279262 RepID=A0A370GUC9_9NOCA|nr:2-oxo-4-hydroxy-4-carboxy-5-ureidoimidazoline decarboxylase [Nocardia mexicana]RDI47101.1 2-oxo-4-hydroxy-4-carboxy-5-ureidoimidazoline decarboxylase [Nocardia mexicana]